MKNPYSEILEIMSNPCTSAQESLKHTLVRLLGGNKLSDKKAIRLKGERSGERWRNPEVSVNELINSNNQSK